MRYLHVIRTLALALLLASLGTGSVSGQGAVASFQPQLNFQDDIVEYLMNSDFDEVTSLEGCEDISVKSREGLASNPNGRAVDVDCQDSPFSRAGLVYFIFQSDKEAAEFALAHASEMIALFDLSAFEREVDGLEFFILYTPFMSIVGTPQANAFATIGKTVIMATVSGESRLNANRYFHYAEDLVVLGVNEFGTMMDPVF